MRQLLDTSLLIKLLHEGKSIEGGISAITLIEVLRGVPENKRPDVKKALEEVCGVIGIDNDVILEYCKLYDTLRRSGRMIADADLIIAASAKARRLILKTLDKDFRTLEDLGVNVGVEEN